MKVFLTGDRSMPEPLALMTAASTIAQVTMEAAAAETNVVFSTGDNGGFEQGVRAILKSLNVDHQVIPTGVNPETKKPAWDTRHEVANAACEKAVFVHTDPLSSSIGSSLMKVMGDKVTMATI